MPGIIGALLYLRITSLQNAVLSRFRRLQQPKYLIGAVVGVAYVYFAFFRRMGLNRPGSAAFPAELLPVVAALGAVVLLIVVVFCWVWPRERASLSFSEAEIAFLFPAPVSRRALIHYRLVSSQIRILFTALIVTLFTSTWSFLLGNAAIRFAGWWLIFATLSLHTIGSAFVITRQLDHGVTSLRRQLVALGVVVLVIAITIAWLWPDLHAPREADFLSFRAFISYLEALFASGPLPWLLLPAKLVLRPLLATDAHSFLAALGPALAIYAAHYLWVLRVEVAFEEASIARAEKRAAKVAALREGKWQLGRAVPKARGAPFDLSAARRPELAFLWKNLLSSAEYLRPRTALIAAGIIVVGCTWLARHPAYEAVQSMIAVFATIVGSYLLVLGPQVARQDLRNDLLNADILKTYPLRGWQIVLGELLTPLAIVTVLLWLALLAVALSFQPQRMQWLTPQVRLGVITCLALVAPLLCALQLLVVNTAAVLFPAWLQTTRGRTPPGIEVMGQRIFFVAGQLFVIVVALLPAALAAAAVFFVSQWMVGVPIAAAFAAVVVLGVLAAEVCLGTWWLGGCFERFDLSAELRP
jgi:hypothetical protein